MLKMNLITAALACTTLFVAAAPAAQAASRSVEFSQTTFENRCLAQGGGIRSAAGGISCETPEAEVRCEFVSVNLADCEWTGIDHQIGVDRIIGVASAESVADEGSGLGGSRPRWRHRVVSF